MSEEERDEFVKIFTKALVAVCVRNGHLENLHAGKEPSSKAGDYSDVKVVTPYGEIPWNEVSRFNDEEMKVLIKDIVNGVYTVLLHEDNTEFVMRFISFASHYFEKWDEPEINPALLTRGKPVD